MKSLMIFGGSGFVGGNLANRALHTGWRVTVADMRPGPVGDWRQADITSAAEVQTLVEESRPDAVVNVAAVADIDLAEREKDLAWRINVDGARNVALACASRGIPYVFFSSDAVFSGDESGYRETDPCAPVNYYGMTKLEAERAVLAVHPHAVVIRISLVLGYPLADGNSFFASLEKKLKEGKPVQAPTYEVRTPLDVLTLSECVLELCQNGYSGLLHLGATDWINRYDLSRLLARRMGFDENLVQPQAITDIPAGRAPRHQNGILIVDRARGLLRTPLLSTVEGVERAFRGAP